MQLNYNAFLTGVEIENHAYVLIYHTQDGETALYYACWKGHSQIVALLAQASADMNQQNKVGKVDVVYTLYIQNRPRPCLFLVL